MDYLLWAQGFIEEAEQTLKRGSLKGFKDNLSKAVHYSVTAVLKKYTGWEIKEEEKVEELLRNLEGFFPGWFNKYIPIICDILVTIEETEPSEDTAEDLYKRAYFVFETCKRLLESGT